MVNRGVTVMTQRKTGEVFFITATTLLREKKQQNKNIIIIKTREKKRSEEIKLTVLPYTNDIY